MIELKVKTVTVDISGNFSVLLVDTEETKVLPIVIGPLEAHNIAMPIQGVTHRGHDSDLLKSAIEKLGGIPKK